MKRQRREQKGLVHVYLPTGCTTWYVRYTHQGRAVRESTGQTSEYAARQHALALEQMLDMARGPLEEKRRLLALAMRLLSEIPELQQEAAKLAASATPPTLAQWLDGLLEQMRHPQRGDDHQLQSSSITAIENAYKQFKEHLGAQAQLALNKITQEHVTGFLLAQRQAGKAGRTRRFLLGRLRSAFAEAVQRGYLHHSPLAGLGRMTWDDASVRSIFTPAQLGALLQACGEQGWLRRSALLGLYTGQRAGDVHNMRWEDVHELEGAEPCLYWRQKKKKQTRLVIPLAKPLAAALRAVPADKRSGWLLADDQERPALKTFNKAWRSLLNSLDLVKLAGGPVVASVPAAGDGGRVRYAWSFHSFRHTVGTHLAGPEAHYLLGHRTQAELALGSTTVYRHSDMVKLRAQLDAIQIS